MGEGGGGGIQGIFLVWNFGQKGFFWSMEDVGIFLGCKKTQGCFGVLYFSSAQINNNIYLKYSLLLVWDFLG